MEVPAVGKVLSKTQPGEEEFPCPGMEAEAKGLLGKRHWGQEPTGKPGPAGCPGRNGAAAPRGHACTLPAEQTPSPAGGRFSKRRRKDGGEVQAQRGPRGQAAHPGPLHQRGLLRHKTHAESSKTSSDTLIRETGTRCQPCTHLLARSSAGEVSCPGPRTGFCPAEAVLAGSVGHCTVPRLQPGCCGLNFPSL